MKLKYALMDLQNRTPKLLTCPLVEALIANEALANAEVDLRYNPGDLFEPETDPKMEISFESVREGSLTLTWLRHRATQAWLVRTSPCHSGECNVYDCFRLEVVETNVAQVAVSFLESLTGSGL